MKILLAAVCIALTVSASFAEIKFTGDAQFRFRYEYCDKDMKGATPDTVTNDYTNRYAWNLKAQITVSDNMLFGVRLSNPLGAATENIANNFTATTASLAPGVTNQNLNLIAIPECYFRWTLNPVSLTAGIVPVEENTVLNLVTYEDDKYLDAGCDPWQVRMNNSQKGVIIDADIMKSDMFSMKAGLLSAIEKDGAASVSKPVELTFNDQLRFMAYLPCAINGKFATVTPIFHVRTAIAEAKDGSAMNHALAGGLDISVQPVEMLGVKFGFAAGGYSNDTRKADTTVTQIKPSGMLLTSCFTVKPGFGTILADFTYGLSKDEAIAPNVTNSVVFADLKYGVPIKKLTIMPRVRFWYIEKSFTLTKVRPELILKGAF